VAALAAANAPTTLWARTDDLARRIEREHVNEEYLSGFALPPALRCTASLADAIGSADLVVMGVPSHGFRSVLTEAAQHVRPWVPVVSLAKGLEQGTLLRMSEVVNEVLPGHPVAVLTGPNLAVEIMAAQPAATVVAIADGVIAGALQRIFSTSRLRVYTNPDLVGCEVSGVVKNVIAIAAGMADGLGFGDNTRATIITRGLAEMTRLGVALGGDPMTFAGLAGMGDLIATCSSSKSRNHKAGVALGQGRTIDEIVAGTSMVAEGIRSGPSVLELGRRFDVELPITEQVVAVCRDGHTAIEALTTLMERQSRPEFETDRH
jgi:glycerol-3-phosphate dehydrogenase (NAD(P)+)